MLPDLSPRRIAFPYLERNRCFFTVLLVIPTAVLLSRWTGVGGYMCPISCNIRHIILLRLQLWTKAPNSASTVEATTNLKMPVLMGKDGPIQRNWLTGFGC